VVAHLPDGGARTDRREGRHRSPLADRRGALEQRELALGLDHPDQRDECRAVSDPCIGKLLGQTAERARRERSELDPDPPAVEPSITHERAERLEWSGARPGDPVEQLTFGVGEVLGDARAEHSSSVQAHVGDEAAERVDREARVEHEPRLAHERKQRERAQGERVRAARQHHVLGQARREPVVHAAEVAHVRRRGDDDRVEPCIRHQPAGALDVRQRGRHAPATQTFRSTPTPVSSVSRTSPGTR
jgi:hypothetical protein